MKGGKPGSKNNSPAMSKYQDKGLPSAKQGGVKSPPNGFNQSVSSSKDKMGKM